ncbi:MAG: hypothetical protein H7A46_21475 [Verrucomicrobiales bacterium]|nr:hypothetical protein [Planctomycetota bacterium]MCP5524117.1 hypothetical protein [Verrucomicrobiales bacterium]
MSQRIEMTKSVPYEVVAVTFMIIGAFLLVATYYPVLNPIQYRIGSHQETAPLSRYLFGTPLSLLILVAAFYFNRRAKRLKRTEKNLGHE